MINKIVPPADYGSAKRWVFNLGVKAHSAPQKWKGELYNTVADMLSLPVSLIRTDYDYGGLRCDIRGALKGSRFEIQLNKIYDLCEIKRYFKPENKKAIIDAHLLKAAVRNLDHYFAKTEIKMLAYFSSFVFAAGFVLGGFVSCYKKGFTGEAAFLFSSAYLFFKLSKRPLVEQEQVSRILFEYIKKIDRQTLGDGLSMCEVSMHTKAFLVYSFGELGNEYRVIREIAKGMPVYDAEQYFGGDQ